MSKITKSYTVKHPVKLRFYRYKFDGKILLSLGSIKCSDPTEDSLIGGEDGQLTPWDADVSFEHGAIVISGSDGPSDGVYGVLLTVPQHLITKISFDNEPGLAEVK